MLSKGTGCSVYCVTLKPPLSFSEVELKVEKLFSPSKHSRRSVTCKCEVGGAVLFFLFFF